MIFILSQFVVRSFERKSEYYATTGRRSGGDIGWSWCGCRREAYGIQGGNVHRRLHYHIDIDRRYFGSMDMEQNTQLDQAGHIVSKFDKVKEKKKNKEGTKAKATATKTTEPTRQKLRL